METTSEPELGSLMASAPTCSPVINWWQQSARRWDHGPHSHLVSLWLLWTCVWKPFGCCSPSPCTSPSACRWRAAPSGWRTGWSGRRSWGRWRPTRATFPPSRCSARGSPGPSRRAPLRASQRSYHYHYLLTLFLRLQASFLHQYLYPQFCSPVFPMLFAAGCIQKCWQDQFHQTSHLEQLSQAVPSLPFPSRTPKEEKKKANPQSMYYQEQSAPEKMLTTTDILTSSSGGHRLSRFTLLCNSHAFLETHWSCRCRWHAGPVSLHRTFALFVWAEKKKTDKQVDVKKQQQTNNIYLYLSDDAFLISSKQLEICKRILWIIYIT